MADVRARIAEDGGIVLPDEYRRALGPRARDEVILRLADGELRILALRPAIRQAQAVARRTIPEDRSLADELIADRRAEATAE